MRLRRASLFVGVAVAVFLAVTFGLTPTVNLAARLRSPRSYSQYDFTGTWVLGLLAGALVAGRFAAAAWRADAPRRRSAGSRSCAKLAAARPVLSLPNASTIVGATITGLGSAADNVVRFNQDRPFTVSLGGVLVGLGVAGMILGRLVAKGATRPRWILGLVAFGTLLTGWALGGGLDNLLSESRGERYSRASTPIRCAGSGAIRTTSGRESGGMSEALPADHRRRRIEVRVSADQDALIREAVDLAGTTITAFVMDTTIARARRVLRQHQDLVCPMTHSTGSSPSWITHPRPLSS